MSAILSFIFFFAMKLGCSIVLCLIEMYADIGRGQQAAIETGWRLTEIWFLTHRSDQVIVFI